MTTFAGHFLGPDTHANRPSVTGLPNGTQYFCTTHSKVERVVSGAWADYYSAGGTETLPVTIFDAKGDLLAGSAADTAARVAVGTDGQVLTADTASAAGVKWATPSAGASGALTLLSTTNLASPAAFDVTSISGSYNDLVCVLIARGADANTTETATWNFNGDTGSNYEWEYLLANGSSVSSVGAASAQGRIISGQVTASTATLANAFGVVEFTIFGYASTARAKTCLWRSAASPALNASSQNYYSGIGIWNSTAAVTRVQMAGATTANMLAGSQLRIYGRL